MSCTGVLVEHRDGTLECPDDPDCAAEPGEHDPVLRCTDALTSCGCSEEVER